MENYHSGDYNKWDSTKCLSDQMLLYSLYYTTNQEEILLAKETLQQVSMEMQQVENKAKKDNTISAVKEIGSFGISLIPFLGDGKDLQESISGLDLITGKKLSALERVLAGACVIVPVISGSMVRIAGKNADIAEKMSLLSEKQLFKKAGKGIAMCEDAKKEMEQLIQGIRTMLEEDADIKRLFIRKTGAGPQVEIAGVGKVSLEEAEKLVGKDVRWSRGESGINSVDDIFTAGKNTFDKFDINNAYVKPKHLSTTGGNGQKFIGASKVEAESILKDTLSNGKIVSISDNGLTKAGNASYEIVIDAGKTVGTKGENLVKIVISSDGGMLSAYPIK